MSNEPFIPVASDPDTYVRNRLVPPNLARQVRMGWRLGVVYVGLKLLAITFLYSAAGTSLAGLLFAGVEIAAACGLVYGVYRWHALAAWTLLALLIISAFAGAIHTPGVPTPGGGSIRVAFLIGFGVVFGRAALAIRAFDKSA